MTTYKIIKGYGATATGREYVIWNVVDAKDGYVYETFDLKRDAKFWICSKYWSLDTLGIN
jgi:hypothetical protein